MKHLMRVKAIRAIEVAYIARNRDDSLMIRAGEAAFRAATRLCEGAGRVLVLAGPGNNGGDAWVTARKLQQGWYKVSVLASGEPSAPEAVAARSDYLSAGGAVLADWPASSQDLVIDGLLGIGLSRPPAVDLAAWIERANASGWPILSLDVPSGLNADTGTCPGSCIRATATITFIADKPGLHTGDGPDVAGTVEVADLGTASDLAADADPANCGVLWVNAAGPRGLPTRRRNTHKGLFGAVGVVGASRGMTGAGLLAARAALFSGAGKVFLAPLDESLPGVDWCQPEIMFRRPRDLLDSEALSAIVIGPGLGVSDTARNVLEVSLKQAAPVVIDADALNLVARGRALQTLLKRRAENGRLSILTPHPAEAARLLDMDTPAINRDRIEAARTLAARFAAIVVLKGVGSVIATADGRWAINGTGNPGMAAGGMGDVLAGILGALIGQVGEGSMSPFDAVQLGVWAHGQAADDCVAAGAGPIGLTPSEVLLACRATLNTRR